MTKPLSHVGLDVHLRTIALAELRGEASQAVVREIPNDPIQIRRTFAHLQAAADLRCCYEAGPCGYTLYRQLRELGVACDVIAPALVPRRPGVRVKTDRRDARELAHLYRAGELVAIHIPSPDQEAVRDLVRAREDVRRDLIAARHRLGKFLLRHGRIYSQGRAWTERYWAWLGHQAFPQLSAQLAFEHYLRQVDDLRTHRRALEQHITDVAQSPVYRTEVTRLSSLRGVSVLSAMVLLTEVHDFRRFPHPRQFMAFVGLVPSERSSGERQQRGGITKTGNAHLRRILVEAAWAYRHRPAIGPRLQRVLASQPPARTAFAKHVQQRLHRRFRRLLSRGKPPQLAITAVARELCGFVWQLMLEPAS